MTMSRIARYFLAEFLKPLFFCVAALIIIMLVSELMEHLDKFIAGKAKTIVVVHYLVSILPLRLLEILPVATLLAALFSLGNLSRRHEITAVMSGGVHPWRAVQPLLITGFIISLFALALNEYIIPPANRTAQRLYKMDIRRYAALKQSKYDNLTIAGKNGVFYAIGLLDADDNRLENVVVDTFIDGKLISQVQAQEARWADDKWTFYRGALRNYGPDGLSLALQEAFDERAMELADTPEDLVPREPDADQMAYKDFKRHLRRLRALGIPMRRQEVDLHMKLAFPLTSFIVLLLGIPFAFAKGAGKVRAVGLALGVAFAYFGLMQVGRALGQKDWFPTLLGAWLANLVFLIIGSGLFLRLRRLS